MSAHVFDPEIAAEVGMNAAVIFQNIKFWILRNAANGDNEFEGRTWTHNSVSAYAKIFPYLSPKQIRTALDKLESVGLIGSGNFNSKGYDRSKWYCLLRQVHLPSWANASALEGEPIPDITTDVIKEESTREHFADFWDAYPHRHGKKTQRGLAKDIFSKVLKSGVTPQEIAAGVEALKRDPDTLRNYQRGPVPWLRQKGWEDEIPETGGQSGNGHSNHTQGQRRDAALENIANLFGVGET